MTDKHTCSECHETFEKDRWEYPSHKRGLCFHCGFWLDKVQLAMTHPLSVVRVDGEHYFIGAEDRSPKALRGLGGRQFTIAFHDGRTATTTNLWCQGKIPERFRERLPDNAKFVD